MLFIHPQTKTSWRNHVLFPVFRSFFLIAAVIFYFLIIIYKVHSDGASNVYHYFTNWSWTLEGFMFLLMIWRDSAMYKFAVRNLLLNQIILSIFVYLAVNVLFWIAPNFISQFFIGNGGDYTISVMMIGNGIYHDFPLIIISMLIIFDYLSFKSILGSYFYTNGRIILIRLIPRLFLPLIVFIIYSLLFDANELYMVNIPMAFIYLFIFLICVVVGIGFYFLTNDKK